MKKRQAGGYKVKRDQDFAPLILCLAIFLSAVILGAVGLKVLAPDDKAELGSYLEIFVRGLGTDTLEPSALFRLSCAQNLKWAFSLWLLGLAVIGAPLVLLLIAVRGFALGFSAAFLIQEVSGTSLFLRGILPHAFFFIPVFLYLGSVAVAFSSELFRERPWIRGGLLSRIGLYSLRYWAFSLLFLVSSLVESYLCPILIQRLLPL